MIIVLTTSGPQYRTAYTEDISVIYGDFDDATQKWDWDESALKEVFENSQVFQRLEYALDKASELSYIYDVPEDFIFYNVDFRDKTFP